MTGNSLKGSRPLMIFDKIFDDDTQPHLKLFKELFTQVWGTPKGHPKSKPFVDHALSFFFADDRVWIRNYQIVYEAEGAKADADPILVEIGPRMVLSPIRVLSSGFSGTTLWENGDYVSPNQIRTVRSFFTPSYHVFG